MTGGKSALASSEKKSNPSPFLAPSGNFNGRTVETRVMMFSITAIAKLLIQLATITPAVNVSIEQIRQLVETIRKPGAGTQNQLDDLKKALELQAAVNKEINDKLKLIETVLQTMQKSLKVLAVVAAGVGLIAVVALVVAVVQ